LQPNLVINVVDTHHLANHHKTINMSANGKKKMNVCTFAGISANQQISQAEQLSMISLLQFKDDKTSLPTISIHTEKTFNLKIVFDYIC
jgi:hypothetical protein